MISVLLPPFKELPYKPGAYVLILKNSSVTEIEVGALGRISFKRGYYAYVGSAMGGLRRRLKRYLEKPARLHWHIDYLLKDERFSVVEIVCVFADAEEIISTMLCKYFEPVKGFGATDSPQESHLFFISANYYYPSITSSVFDV